MQAGVTSPIGVASVMLNYQPAYGQWSQAPMSLSSGDVNNGTWGVTIGPLPPGVLSYTIMAMDTLGQGSGTLMPGQLTINMPLPPVVSTPTFNPAVPTAGTTFTVQAGVTSPIGVASVMLNYQPAYGQWSQAPMSLSTGSITNGTWSATIGPLPSGILSYTIMAVDSLGQGPSIPTPGQLKINMPSPPVVSTPAFTPAAPTAGTTFTVQAGVTSPIGIMSVMLNYQPAYGQWSQAPMSLSAGTITNGTWSATIGPLPPGTLSYSIMAVDTLGQGPCTPIPEKLTLDMPPPPVVSTPTFTPAAPAARARRSPCRPA